MQKLMMKRKEEKMIFEKQKEEETKWGENKKGRSSLL
jgi:hypothetical protein